MDDTLSIEERQTRALESIAGSLLKLSNPPVAFDVSTRLTDADLAAMKRGPSSITYVDRFGRPTTQPDRTA